MIIHQRLLNKKFITLAFSLLTTLSVRADYCPQNFEVVIHNDKEDYSLEKRPLEKLFCTNSFEGEHFKIVNSTGDKAISFDHDDKELIKKAANVYYHLTIARDYWIDTIKSDFVKDLPQITIRLNITNAYSNVRHFKNAEQQENYNNAWSIPEGHTPKSAKEKLVWGKEIWFSPMKKIESRSQLEKSEGNNPIHESLVLIKDPLVNLQKSALIYQGIGTLVNPTNINNTALLNIALKRIATLVTLYGLIGVTKYMDKWFVEKYYYIDTAMIPDIIYHEFSHIAMSDTMTPVHSVPVIEGMADYFASRISNHTKMYQKLKKFSNNRSKNLKNKNFYHPYLEGAWNATSDYTVSLLWSGKMKFDEMNKKRSERGQDLLVDYDQLIFNTHFKIEEHADISSDLTRALVDTCEEMCTNKRAGINTLNQVFEQKGLD
jgi:hypothetical protein